MTFPTLSRLPGPLAPFESLSVVIPAYNAARCITSTLDDIRRWLDVAGVRHEIIVVDDGSTDETAGLVTSYGGGVRLLRNGRNRGKGYTVRHGMLAAGAPWRLFMDADNSVRIETLERMGAAAAEGAGVIVASRRVAGATILRPQSPIRRLLGNSFPYLVRTFALPGLRDSQCGFKLFRADAADAIFSRARVERFAFDVEALLLARRLDFRIVEVPVSWNNPTESTVKIHFDTAQMFLDLMKTGWRLRASRAIPAPDAAESEPPEIKVRVSSLRAERPSRDAKPAQASVSSPLPDR